MKTQNLFIIALIAIIFSSCGGTGSNNPGGANIESLSAIIDSIKNEGTVDCPGIANLANEMFTGEDQSSSKQQKNYQELKETATVEQLITLTDNKNAVVRCYAFQALATKNSDNLFKIVLKHLNDTSIVRDQNGMTLFAGDYFVDLVTGTFIDNETYKLSPVEKETLDSIFLNDNSIKLSAKSSIFATLKPTPGNYAKIRELVKNDRNQYALQTLAKYQNQTDKELIISFFKADSTASYALNAAEEFPDSYFYPFVKKIFQREWEKGSGFSPEMKTCYKVLARYPIPETIEMFEKTEKLQDENSSKRTFIYFLLLAVRKYPDKLYDPITQKIKLSSYEVANLRKLEELETRDNY